jgi:Mg2+ and Co2+ transporter CorA
VLTAIVAPFEFISQLFGMGVGGVPLHDNPYGFWVVVAMILITIGLGAVLVRRFLGRS